MWGGSIHNMITDYTAYIYGRLLYQVTLRVVVPTFPYFQINNEENDIVFLFFLTITTPF